MPRPMPRQLFLLEEDFIRSFSVEEVALVWGDMVEMNLANDPFEDYDVIIPAKCFIHLNAEIADRGTFDNWKVKFRFTGRLREDWFIDRIDGNWFSLEEVLSEVDPNDEMILKRGEAFEMVRRLLIVALATKNVRKSIRQNKAARLGIGKAAREGYATTIRLEVGEIAAGAGGCHSSPRPHLRAGHIRRQHYGQDMALIKKIWIAPTFVNVDEEFVNSRTAYRFTC